MWGLVSEDMRFLFMGWIFTGDCLGCLLRVGKVG